MRLPIASQVILPAGLLVSSFAQAQTPTAASILFGASLPATCPIVGTLFILSTDGTASLCTAVDTWTTLNLTGGGGVPAGSVVMIKSGTCSAGWTEDTSLNGKTLVGTLAANGDVGSTGGSDDITPAGTVTQPTFTGSALGTHSHAVGTYAAANESAHTHGGPTISWPAGVPTAANESSHTHTVTAPTISWPAGVPTISGIAVSDHASHTHTYTEVPNHVHVQSVNSGTTGGTNGYGVDTSTSGSSASGYSTANPTGGVATGTTAGPSATLTHTVSSQGTVAWPAGVPTNSAPTSGAGSAHTHTISWPAGVPTNGSTGAGSAHTHSLSGSSEAVSGGTPAGTVSQPSFTGSQFDNRSAFIKVIFCRKN